MYCTRCGKQLPDRGSFCPNCGAKKQVAEAPAQQIPGIEHPDTQESIADSDLQPTSSNKQGIAYIIAGIVVFIVCSAIQSLGDSSMFSFAFYKTGNALLDIIISITMIPGWIATVILIVNGVRSFGKRGSRYSSSATSNASEKTVPGIPFSARTSLLWAGAILLVLSAACFAFEIQATINMIQYLTSGTLSNYGSGSISPENLNRISMIVRALIPIVLAISGIMILVSTKQFSTIHSAKSFYRLSGVADILFAVGCCVFFISFVFISSVEILFQMNLTVVQVSFVQTTLQIAGFAICLVAGIIYIVAGRLQKKIATKTNFPFLAAGVALIVAATIHFIIEVSVVDQHTFFSVTALVSFFLFIGQGMRSLAPLSFPKSIECDSSK